MVSFRVNTTMKLTSRFQSLSPPRRKTQTYPRHSMSSATLNVIHVMRIEGIWKRRRIEIVVKDMRLGKDERLE